MHDYFAHELHRERLARFEREAELRRLVPRRTLRLPHIGLRIPLSRRPQPLDPRCAR